MLDHLVRQSFPDRNLEILDDLRNLASERFFLRQKHHHPHPVPSPPQQPPCQTYPKSLRADSFPHLGEVSIYVGPVSSFYFANIARQLVSKSHLGNMSTFSEAGFNLKRYLKATEFTSFRISQALEARIRGHPATNVTEDEHVDGTGEISGGAHNHERSAYKSPLVSSTTSILSRKYGPLLDLLPERTLSDRLVGAFLNVFILISQYSTGKRYSLDPEPGWVCALMMTLVLGAQTLEDTTTSSSSHSGFLTLTQAQSIQQTYLTLVIKEGLSRLALTANLTNVPSSHAPLSLPTTQANETQLGCCSVELPEPLSL
ncbi:hypothetical protein K435DRAFT_880854 [Dendrothele bispora CBS 962.96]|uniref:Uncharacterized protein n=1 Tax=Dendrothele bispora (strain CBS 962.96) TaxID=1314807 RepID=A0A4S8KIY7_DENBC|nr:hypothetical protein K435DRAFT_880854 [Dendrothele bispora CBS 962.96]